MILYFVLEFILVMTIIIVSFVLFKAILRKPVSAESIKVLINACFIAFLISIVYMSIIETIDHIYGNEKSSQIVMVLLMLFNISFYTCFTAIYYNKKMPGTDD